MMTEDLDEKLNRFNDRMKKGEDEKMADEEKPKIDIGKEVEKLEDIVRKREWAIDSVTAQTAADAYKIVGDDPNVLSDKKKAEEMGAKVGAAYDGHAMTGAKNYFGASKNTDELAYHLVGGIGSQVANQMKEAGKDWNLAALNQHAQEGKKHAMQYPNIKLSEGIKALPVDDVKSYLGLDPAKAVNEDLFKNAQAMYQIIKGVQAKEKLYK